MSQFRAMNFSSRQVSSLVQRVHTSITYFITSGAFVVMHLYSVRQKVQARAHLLPASILLRVRARDHPAMKQIRPWLPIYHFMGQFMGRQSLRPLIFLRLRHHILLVSMGVILMKRHLLQTPRTRTAFQKHSLPGFFQNHLLSLQRSSLCAMPFHILITSAPSTAHSWTVSKPTCFLWIGQGKRQSSSIALQLSTVAFFTTTALVATRAQMSYMP